MANDESLLTDKQLREVVRTLFRALNMVRVFDQDYETAIATLRSIYNQGRKRGLYEAAGPERG